MFLSKQYKYIHWLSSRCMMLSGFPDMWSRIAVKHVDGFHGGRFEQRDLVFRASWRTRVKHWKNTEMNRQAI